MGSVWNLIPGRGEKFFPAPYVQPSLGPVQWETGVKQPEHKKDYSPLSSAEVKKWSCTAAPPPHLYGVDRGQLYLFVSS